MSIAMTTTEARHDESGEGMSAQQLRDEVMTIFAAGHETTANALAWTFYLLSLNPAVARRLRAELCLVDPQQSRPRRLFPHSQRAAAPPCAHRWASFGSRHPLQ